MNYQASQDSYLKSLKEKSTVSAESIWKVLIQVQCNRESNEVNTPDTKDYNCNAVMWL